MVERRSLRVTGDDFDAFESRLGFLDRIMRNRAQLRRTLPGATIRAVPLDRWPLGLD